MSAVNKQGGLRWC